MSISCECCQIEISTLGRSLVQKSPTECGVSECHGKASTMRKFWPVLGCCALGGEGMR